MTERAVNGDFHVIKMDGLFHVVFRPDSDPEWFRIIASFYTYERAWSYCDVERVSVWTYTNSETGQVYAESETGDEERGGLRPAPVVSIPGGGMASRDGCSDMVRSICPEADVAVQAHPDEDFNSHPHEDEPPKDYAQRIQEEAIAAICRAADQMPPDDGAPADPMAEAISELSDSQWSVLRFFQDHADGERLVRASVKDISEKSGTSKGSTTFLIEALERKGFIGIVERGNSTSATLYRLHTAEEKAAAGDSLRCSSCGGPRAIGSASRCKACYQGAGDDLPPELVGELSKAGQRALAASK